MTVTAQFIQETPEQGPFPLRTCRRQPGTMTVWSMSTRMV